MYPGKHAAAHADRPAFIMAGTGETVTYAELEARTNRLAHLLRASGLKRLDHYSIFMENNARYVECCAAGERTGLYYTCINSYLTADELAYIVDNSESKVLITSQAKRDGGARRARAVPEGRAVPRSSTAPGDGGTRRSTSTRRRRACPTRRSPTSALGTPMLYSSGTTGRPKGILRPLPENPPAQPLPLFELPDQALAVPRGHDLPVAGAALSLGAAGRRRPHDPQRRHGRDHGALRPRAVSRARSRSTASPTASSCRRCSRAC